MVAQKPTVTSVPVATTPGAASVRAVAPVRALLLALVAAAAALSLLFGVLVGMGRMSSDSELVALRWREDVDLDRRRITVQRSYSPRYGFKSTKNDKIRDMVLGNASTDELRDEAQRHGMVPLRQFGIEVANDGVTTLDEIIRETVQE